MAAGRPDPAHLRAARSREERARNHPATLDLIDPRGRPCNDRDTHAGGRRVLRFDLRTAEDAPTGDWTARVTLGGAASQVAEGRDRDAQPAEGRARSGRRGAGRRSPSAARCSRRGCSGASAAGLRTDVKLRLTPARTRSTASPTTCSTIRHAIPRASRTSSRARSTRRGGPLRRNDRARRRSRRACCSAVPRRGSSSPAAPSASTTLACALLPLRAVRGPAPAEGRLARGMLLTDRKHRLEIGSSPRRASPRARRGGGELYKVDWRWWWDRGEEYLARVAREQSTRALVRATSRWRTARARRELRDQLSALGPLPGAACDQEGGHRTGSVLYIDWPGWAGRGQKEAGGGGQHAPFAADKPSTRRARR